MVLYELVWREKKALLVKICAFFSQFYTQKDIFRQSWINKMQNFPARRQPWSQYLSKISRRVKPKSWEVCKVNNRNTRKRCEISSNLTIKAPERRQWRRSGVFIVNFEYTSHIVNFQQRNVSWEAVDYIYKKAPS